MAQSGHNVLQRKCPLLTQSGHRQKQKCAAQQTMSALGQKRTLSDFGFWM
jgi:hypothetical protein